MLTCALPSIGQRSRAHPRQRQGLNLNSKLRLTNFERTRTRALEQSSKHLKASPLSSRSQSLLGQTSREALR